MQDGDEKLFQELRGTLIVSGFLHLIKENELPSEPFTAYLSEAVRQRSSELELAADDEQLRRLYYFQMGIDIVNEVPDDLVDKLLKVAVKQLLQVSDASLQRLAFLERWNPANTALQSRIRRILVSLEASDLLVAINN